LCKERIHTRTKRTHSGGGQGWATQWLGGEVGTWEEKSRPLKKGHWESRLSVVEKGKGSTKNASSISKKNGKNSDGDKGEVGATLLTEKRKGCTG